MITIEPTTQQTKADQLRKCADWLDRNDVRGYVLISTHSDHPHMDLRLDDLRRCFNGVVAKKRIARHCTTYSLEADGIVFESSVVASHSFMVTETEVTL